ncbi:MAG: Pr6Pr family membrane protein [Sphingomicrobium sp.]
MTAVVGWFGLALQLILIVDNLGPALGIWRFVGFFTILANIGSAGVATAIALGGRGGLASAKSRLMALTSIVTVGIVYSLLLRSVWSPQGWQKVADATLHDVTPILFVLLWAMMPQGKLKWRDLKWALVPPALYLAYALARGAVDGWYAYWFLDPSRQSLGELGLSIVGVLAVFAVVGGLGIAVDRRLPARERSAST